MGEREGGERDYFVTIATVSSRGSVALGRAVGVFPFAAACGYTWNPVSLGGGSDSMGTIFFLLLAGARPSVLMERGRL